MFWDVGYFNRLLSVAFLCFRIIFLGLITCLTGSSYFFIIAVIVLLRRQFKKPQQETETPQPKASNDIELKTSNPIECEANNPKTPTQPHNIKAGGLSSIDTQEEMQLPEILTETEFAPLPSDKEKTEKVGLKSEEEATEGNAQICKDRCTCESREAEQSHTEDKKELEEK